MFLSIFFIFVSSVTPRSITLFWFLLSGFWKRIVTSGCFLFLTKSKIKGAFGTPVDRGFPWILGSHGWLSWCFRLGQKKRKIHVKSFFSRCVFRGYFLLWIFYPWKNKNPWIKIHSKIPWIYRHTFWVRSQNCPYAGLGWFSRILTIRRK